jgi:hypothetical protein
MNESLDINVIRKRSVTYTRKHSQVIRNAGNQRERSNFRIEGATDSPSERGSYQALTWLGIILLSSNSNSLDS